MNEFKDNIPITNKDNWNKDIYRSKSAYVLRMNKNRSQILITFNFVGVLETNHCYRKPINTNNVIDNYTEGIEIEWSGDPFNLIQ